jgi:hypothetical protein
VTENSNDYIEQKLNTRHKRILNLLEANEELLYKYFLNKHADQINLAKDLTDTLKIKEQLRIMPYSASKVLIFKIIIDKEKTF